MKIQNDQLKKFSVDVLYDIISAISFTIGLSCFTAPAQIAPGGVSGLAVLVNYLTGAQLGTVILLINIPLLMLAWKFLGRAFTIKTMKTVAIQTVFLNILSPIIPEYRGESMLAALFGGICIGTALASAFMRGTTTGGTDIAGRLIQLKFRHVPIGKMMMFVDALVLATSMLVFRNIETGLYGIIAIFTTSKVIDGVLYGMNTGKVLLVISEKKDIIAKEIQEKIDRGVTFLYAQGAYSGEDKKIIMCAVRSTQYHSVEEIIKHHDPEAFVLTLEAGEIQGEGFRPLTQEKIT